jgi:hypothetical protein
MHYKMVDEKPKTFVLVFETNDELAQTLQEFATKQKLASASFKAIGAFSSVCLDRANLSPKPSTEVWHFSDLAASPDLPASPIRLRTALVQIAPRRCCRPGQVR